MLIFKTANNPHGALWDSKTVLKEEIELYQVLQALQWFDVIFPLLGFTRSVVINAFLQTLARSIFGFITLPMHHPYLPVTLPVLYCFAAGEGTRYLYNLFTILGIQKTMLGRVVGHLRWNLFLILYPIGALGDGLAGCFTVPVLKAMDPMPYSMTMPNKYNFSWNMAYGLTVMPFIYMLQFPINFGHLLRKRREFYAEALYKEV